MEILAEIITDTLVKEKIINSDDSEIYKYGAELLISTGANLLLGLLLGGLFHSMMSGVIYFLVLATLRHRQEVTMHQLIYGVEWYIAFLF